MFREPEVVVLFLTKLDLTPLGTELSVRPTLLVGQELFLTHAVVAAAFALVDPAAFTIGWVLFVPQPLQDGTNAILVARVGGLHPSTVIHLQLFPQGDKLPGDSIDEGLRRDPLLLRRLLHLLPVLIHPGEKEDFLSFQAVVARQHIGQHLLVGVPDVG